MSYRLVLSGEARQDLRSLEKTVQRRIVKKLLYFLHSADPLSFAKPLVGKFKGLFRFRVGDYRVVFRVSGGEIKILFVIRIEHRREVYE